MTKKNIITAITFLMVFLGYSQKAEEILKKVTETYGIAKPLSYTMSYSLYKDHDSKKVEENYKGVFHKNAANETYIKIKDSEMINSLKTNVKISHSEKAIVISNPVGNSVADFDMRQISDLCKVISVKDFKIYWEIQLEPKQYSDLSYSKIILNISKDYFLQKQVFYYNTAINFSQNYRTSDTHYPRLEVVYQNHNRKAADGSWFNTGKYYTVSGKNTIVLSQQLKKYEVIDQRIASNIIK